ncbi:O-linked N-acetylglucosamine transferase, SPINDLY family protein [Phormidium sp. CLA17]|uniref:O-linked N-acetylglucosamine transferase, SPINDLY family protein n=1 Tax=Leptolyngbya sp. Cla-17 TaxID=2803751 RepID=UPI0014917EBD|nr:O-linked N-acetylglucosamine transferase, SPINDLY family protein [Leptolyngbya sp. Cla-17]MBM0743671.1 O-linked N-acetylglucosamine transferase, SPINDLY family protein [Leptolyngbya sp. Cla-17]
MTNKSLSANWQQQADRLIQQNNYSQAASLYEQAIETEPDVKSHYWHLGMLMVLQEQEAEAQTIWLMAMADGELEQIDQWTVELGQVLVAAAIHQTERENLAAAWALRRHLQEISPDDLNNRLNLVSLAIALENLTPNDLQETDIISLLKTSSDQLLEVPLLLHLLNQILTAFAPHPIALEFAEACLKWVSGDVMGLMTVMLPASIRIAHALRQPKFAAELLALYCRVDDQNIEILGHLSGFYQDADLYDLGIQTAQRRGGLPSSLLEQIFSSHLLLRGLMTPGGYWQEGLIAIQQHRQLLTALLETVPTIDIPPIEITRLLTSSFFLPYFKDDPKLNRSLQNQVAAWSQTALHQRASKQIVRYQSRSTPLIPSNSVRPLKIGYLSHCMARHSVGWLARWLIKHHDRSRFQLHGYFINDRKHDSLYQWYVNQMDHACRIGVEVPDSEDLAERIYQDDIDILIDLDSITLDLSSDILALKPAPIQVTWLGWDATGIPGVDYFIADPYVLPDNAQDYYTETIWRLPQTYIAVDGFEVEVPSLRRDHLDISNDAVIFLSAQKGYKRHADTAHLQMRIIKNVPNSYFLIKGSAEQDSIQQFFIEIALSEGVAPDRLRFLPETLTEGVHRADLAIADVVLDTYPYNGATTTLETLWMGVPLITRVGEQFAARNSYTMLKNVGIEEGIAWTDEEYVEWGVRLGTDAALRQQIHWKLRRSRQTSPLWNAAQFTREMEEAYQQMWIHCKQ